jgi:hypothetical protein
MCSYAQDENLMAKKNPAIDVVDEGDDYYAALPQVPLSKETTCGS